MGQWKAINLVLAFGITFGTESVTDAQAQANNSTVLERCVEYSNAGDLLEAQVTQQSFSILLSRPNGQRIKLTGSAAPSVISSAVNSRTTPCQLGISDSSEQAALALATDKGLSLELIDLKKGSLETHVLAPKEFPIQFSIHPAGYAVGSDQLQVSQAHYLPTGEPEIVTKLISPNGTVTATYKTLGAPYTEVFGSSFDFRRSLVWFFCPVYAVRWDRQPPCTLRSEFLNSSASATPTIPPRPGTGDARISGNSPVSLGFPSSNDVVVLAMDNLWVYDLSNRSFRQMRLPETPRHIRWIESPGQPKFTSDGHFAAVPVFLFHAPLFEEGQVSHGTKLLIIDMAKLEILRTIQPLGNQNVTDFALRDDEGKSLTLIASWGSDWQSFDIPLSSTRP
ncbi:MAG TPA: hypothetical protein VIJ65_05710 [Acidobacteriaceae bacterium]